MLSLYETFEQRREFLRSKIAQDPRPSAAVSAVSECLDQLLYKFVEETDDEALEEAASGMIRLAKFVLPLMEAVNETKIWSSRVETEPAVSRRKNPAGMILCVFFAVLSLAAFALLVYPYVHALEIKLILQMAGVLVVAVAFIYLTGIMAGRKKDIPKEKTELRSDVFVNTEDVIRRLTALILQMDKELSALKEDNDNEPLVGDDKEFPPRLLEFYSNLLEGSYSADGDIALEKLGDAVYYIHTQGIDLKDFAKDTQELFEFLPGREERTLIPAMMYRDRLLRKGLATRKE